MPGLPVEVAGAEAQGGPSELRLCSPGSVAWWWCALSVSLSTDPPCRKSKRLCSSVFCSTGIILSTGGALQNNVE